MNNLFKFTDAIKVELESNDLLNSVTMGDLFDIDLLKKNTFPLAHVVMTTASISAESGVAYLNMSVLLLDMVDESKEEETDHYYGNDNEHYVKNSMFAVATKLVSALTRGKMHTDGYQIGEDVNVEFFSERFEDKLAGVGLDFSVAIKNTIDIC
tara:strand:- start:3848 stop:4309 length:462 start_codon:yes stop_codon:yes gene_type:complete